MGMMKRMENQKFKQLVTTARHLFWHHGIRRISISEICRESGVSKMTFYKHFANKTELVIFIIDWLVEEAIAEYRAIMEQDVPFAEKVRQTIEFKLKQNENLSHEFLHEIYQSDDPEVQSYVAERLHHNIDVILADYAEAQQRGDIRADIKPEFINYVLNQMTLMAQDDQLLALYETPQQLIMELVRFFFYGILPRGECG